jgi:2-C-methyl-D-erythritol 4-phosphate cytidylyltransferase
MRGSIKAFLSAGDMTLLELVVERLKPHVSEVIVGLPPAHVERGKELVGEIATVVGGGESRQATLENALSFATSELVVIHDVARPFVSDHLISEVIGVARLHGAAAPVVPIPVRDSLALIDGDHLGPPIDRRRLVAIQTPYAFGRELLTVALDNARASGVVSSSVTTLIHQLGVQVHSVVGDPDNMKITYPEDWERAKDRLG